MDGDADYMHSQSQILSWEEVTDSHLYQEQIEEWVFFPPIGHPKCLGLMYERNSGI